MLTTKISPLTVTVIYTSVLQDFRLYNFKKTDDVGIERHFKVRSETKRLVLIGLSENADADGFTSRTEHAAINSQNTVTQTSQ